MTIIVNNCLKKHRIQYVKIIENILIKIPDKYLYGLAKVVFTEKESPRMKYIIVVKKKYSIIEINMDYDEYKGYPFFSIFSLNTDFLIKINEHIDKFLKPISNDSDILSYKLHKIKIKWMYLGIWTPISYLLIVFSYPFQKIKTLKQFIFDLSKKMTGQ